MGQGLCVVQEQEKEKKMLVKVNYMKSLYPLIIEADSVKEALDEYWSSVEWDEDYEILEENAERTGKSL